MIDIIYHDGASAAPDQAAQSGGFAQADGNGEIHCYSWLDGVSASLCGLAVGICLLVGQRLTRSNQFFRTAV